MVIQALEKAGVTSSDDSEEDTVAEEADSLARDALHDNSLSEAFEQENDLDVLSSAVDKEPKDADHDDDIKALDLNDLISQI